MGRKDRVHTTPDEFEIDVFTLTTCQMFSVGPHHFGFVFEKLKTRSGKSHGYCDVISVFKMFSVHT